MMLWGFCGELCGHILTPGFEKRLRRINEYHDVWENLRIVLDDAFLSKDGTGKNRREVACRISGIALTDGRNKEQIRSCLIDYLAFVTDHPEWKIYDLKQIGRYNLFNRRTHWGSKMGLILERLGVEVIESRNK